MAARRPSAKQDTTAKQDPTRHTAPAPAAAAPDQTPAAPTATFAELGVPAKLIAVLTASGITAPFPIQTATLPDSLAGRDVLGRGRTGSGKTLAFVLPMLARLAASPSKRQPSKPRALILAPTRELAAQIHAALAPLAEALALRSTTVFGGVGARPQISALRGGIDILIACPGRLADHVETGHADLSAVEITVLDEADHMADLGFLPVVKRLLDKTPAKGQRMLFSATLDGGVDTIVRRYLREPVTHSVDSAQSPVSAMTHHVLHIETEHRLPVLIDLAAAPGRTILFTRTKHGAKKLTKQLLAARVPAVELHGNLAQNARTRNLAAFTDGRATTLVATDIAARGIHVDDVALVVHADPPVEHKAYLHRSGRTARAGAAGTVITLMTTEQRNEVRDLTRKAGIKPTTTRLAPGDKFLRELAPGERIFSTVEETAALSAPAEETTGNRQGGARNKAPARRPAAQGTARGGSAKSGAPAADRGSSARSGASRGGSGSKQGEPGRGRAAQGGQPTRARQSAGDSAGRASTGQARQAVVPVGVSNGKPKRSGAISLSERASGRVGSPRRSR
jgi:superfamily II DNA/RNA helicase